ncbi:MAG TPA: efflux RND transporter periplasmic adaptor subunit [Geothrix sp.]|nr:efflux RND transporter periplasmic adaptor subunit [Geothrix sp.]
MDAQKRRSLLIITVSAVVAIALVWGFLPKPLAVEVLPVTRGPLRITVEEEGRTRVKDRYIVSAPVAGFLRRIAFEVGDPIRKGQVVATLEPLRATVLDPRTRAEAEAAAASARAVLEAAKARASASAADAEFIHQRFLRMRKLAETGQLSQNELEQAESESKKAGAVLQSAQASELAAKADLARAESALGYSAAEPVAGTGKWVSVRAPAGGHVLKLIHESEGVVNSGEPLLEVGHPRDLEVKAELLSADAVKIKPAMQVIFDRWGGEQPLWGRVRNVEPAGFTKVSSLGVEEQRVLVIVDFTSPAAHWQGLGDAYRLDASFILWEGENVLQVPASALFRKGNGWAVFVAEHQRARMRSVQVGHRSGLLAEVEKGLIEGDLVIVHPDDRLNEGCRVRTN